jgi:hypothetical protein
VTYLPWLPLNHDLTDLSLPSSWDYRYEPLVPGYISVILEKAYMFSLGKFVEISLVSFIRASFTQRAYTI